MTLNPFEPEQPRTVVEIVGRVPWFDGRYARKVVAEYGDGTRRTEIELTESGADADGEYKPKYGEL